MIMTTLSFIEPITFIRVRVIFEAVDPIGLPVYKGSAFRGCLGEALRYEVCNQRGVECATCRERFGCPFSRLFNSYVADDHPHHRKYPKSPHPYIIGPLPGSRTNINPGETFGFDLTLIGTAIELLPLLLRVFYRMGETGIGKGRGWFKPIELQTLTPALTYGPLPWFGQPEPISLSKIDVPKIDHCVTICIENPLRLRENGKLVNIPPEFGLFTRRLAQRIGLLSHFHCGAPWPGPELEPFAVTNGIRIRSANVQLTDWRRYSGTQDTTMNFDGITGQITYEGEGLNDWMPLFTLGSWLHAGSTATFGLGKYSISGS
jgi:hypothetical protein